MDPHLAKHSTLNDVLAGTHNQLDIKKVSKAGRRNRREVVITKCLHDPCAGFYTDTISGSIFIRCNDPRHTFNGGAKDKN